MNFFHVLLALAIFFAVISVIATVASIIRDRRAAREWREGEEWMAFPISGGFPEEEEVSEPPKPKEKRFRSIDD